MIIENGLVFEENGTFRKRSLFISSSHKILEKPEPGDTHIINARNLYVIPGLVDVHIHGASGYDFCGHAPESLAKIAAYLKSHGITSFCPTSMSLPLPRLERIFRTLGEVPKSPAYAVPAGIHMEGPFLAPARKGAQKEAYLVSPDIDSFRKLYDSCGGRIRIVTIAPELPGAREFIGIFHDSLSISLGHSAASYETAYAAYEAGANHATHLFNGMEPLHHRNPGIIGAAADNSHVMAEVICDGVHISPSVIRIIFKIFGDERVVLVSDAMRAAGMPDGAYELGGQAVYKKGAAAVLADGSLAGSVSNLFDCMKKAVSFGIPLGAAVKAASLNPARSIGASRIGSLEPGKEADVLLLDKNLSLLRVI